MHSLHLCPIHAPCGVKEGKPGDGEGEERGAAVVHGGGDISYTAEPADQVSFKKAQ